MRIQNRHFLKIVSLSLLFTLCLTTSKLTFAAQGKLAGELTVTGAEGYVTINGEKALSGRAVSSPAELVTYGQVTAKVSLAKTGVVILAPNSKMNLNFNPENISGEFVAGKLTLDVLPNTALNLQTGDGAITVADNTVETVINVDFENGRTRVSTLSGAVLFKGGTITAGQTYSAGAVNANNQQTGGSGGGSGISKTGWWIIAGIAGAVGVGLLVGLSGGDDDVVSPVR